MSDFYRRLRSALTSPSQLPDSIEQWLASDGDSEIFRGELLREFNAARGSVLPAAYNADRGSKIEGTGKTFRREEKKKKADYESFLEPYVYGFTQVTAPEAWEHDPESPRLQEPFGKRLVNAIEAALRAGDWGFVEKVGKLGAKHNRALEKSPKLRDQLLIQNWLIMASVNRALPGLCWLENDKAFQRLQMVIQAELTGQTESDDAGFPSAGKLKNRINELGLVRIPHSFISKIPLEYRDAQTPPPL